MLAIIAFIMLFFFCASSASGTAKLIYIAIQPGELLGGWQKVLNRIEPQPGDKHHFLREFWYKRLGGCIICMRQFIAELSFIVFCVMYNMYGTWPGQYLEPWPAEWMLNIVLFVGYCGMTLQIGQWMEYEKREADSLEKIVETTYYDNNEN